MKTALLVIDPQKIYTDRNSEMYCPNSTATIKRINTLLETAEARKQLVILVRHMHKHDGSDLGRLFDFAGDVVEDFNFNQDVGSHKSVEEGLPLARAIEVWIGR